MDTERVREERVVRDSGGGGAGVRECKKTYNFHNDLIIYNNYYYNTRGESTCCHLVICIRLKGP